MGEATFITENQAQLGSGSGKRTLNYIYAMVNAFLAIPVVFQILILVGVAMIIFTIPYILLNIYKAIEAPETKARMITSGLTSLVLALVILLVHFFL